MVWNDISDCLLSFVFCQGHADEFFPLDDLKVKLSREYAISGGRYQTEDRGLTLRKYASSTPFTSTFTLYPIDHL